MSVTITGMNPSTFGGDTGYPLQAIVGGLVIEPPATGPTVGAVPAQVQIGPLAVQVPVTKTAATQSVGATETVMVFNASGTVTLTLPTAANYPGRVLIATTVAAQALNSASSNVVPANSTSAGTSILAGTAGKWAVLVSNGTNWQIVANN